MFVSFGPIPSTPLQIIIIAAGYHKMNFLCVACVLWCVQKKGMFQVFFFNIKYWSKNNKFSDVNTKDLRKTEKRKLGAWNKNHLILKGQLSRKILYYF